MSEPVGVFHHFPPTGFLFMPTPLDKIPPFICRLVARDKTRVRALTVDEIAVISGLNRRAVQRLSNAITWDGVRMDTAFRFASACGVNLLKCGDIHRRRLTWTRRIQTKSSEIEKWLSQLGRDNR